MRPDQAGPAVDPFAYIDIGSIDTEKKRIVDPKLLSAGSPPSRARQRLMPGDVLVSMTRPNLNAVAWIGADLADAIGSTGFHVLRGTDCSSKFLFYRVQCTDFVDAMSGLTQGALYPAVRPKDIQSFPISVPPVREQHRIVAAIEEHLTNLDAAVAALQRSRANAGGYCASLLSSQLEGEALRSYPLEALGDLIAEPLRNGHSAKRTAGAGVRTLTLTAVTERDFSEKNTKLTEASIGRVDDLWLRPGDIFVERGNTPELVGTAALYDGPEHFAIFPDLLIRVRVSDRLNPRYVDYVLRTHRARAHFRSRAQGIAGSMPKIDQAAVASLPIRVLPLEMQISLAEGLDAAFSAVDRLEAQIDAELRRAIHLRQSILKRAFEGKLVPQDPSDEPASALLDRIRTASTASRPSPSRPAAVRSRSGRR